MYHEFIVECIADLSRFQHPRQLLAPGDVIIQRTYRQAFRRPLFASENQPFFFNYFLSDGIHGNGIFTYIYHENQPNVGKYTLHGSYGFDLQLVDAIGLKKAFNSSLM